jgi:molybdopterin/thiamine biosynthesis adenylyltransferase
MPCQRLSPDRFDADFLLPRGGANIELKTKSVAVIGCGAVGSYIVQHLAAVGLGEFRLVDPEALANGNCHRHVLGAEHVGTKKVKGLAEEFSEKYPHETYFVKDQRIQDVLATEPDFVLGADLVVVAVGDETLALSLNRALSPKRQIYAWLDPMGLGGHVLSTGNRRGCLECLFKRHPGHSLYNAASFAAPGQSFQKSFAGCAGVFTPFSALDANRVATIAARHAVNVLLGKEERNLLISWLGERQPFEQSGFRVSIRTQMFAAGEERIETGFAADRCPVCGGRQQ